jgi:flagellar basal body-associated protein FliL
MPSSYQGAYKSRSLIIEIVIAVLAAAAVGVAVFFLALSVGIYL